MGTLSTDGIYITNKRLMQQQKKKLKLHNNALCTRSSPGKCQGLRKWKKKKRFCFCLLESRIIFLGEGLILVSSCEHLIESDEELIFFSHHRLCHWCNMCISNSFFHISFYIQYRFIFLFEKVSHKCRNSTKIILLRNNKNITKKKRKTIVFLFLSSLRTGPFSKIPSPNSFSPSYRKKKNNKRKEALFLCRLIPWI